MIGFPSPGRGLVAVAFIVGLGGPAFAQAPTLRRITLSASGVAQYEMSAELDGPGRLSLDVPLDRVSDVLKSLVIADPAGGQASLVLPGRQPLAEAFRTLPFPQEALASPEALLASLIGAEVRIAAAGISGRLLSVTSFEAKLPDGAVLTRHRVAIATATGLDSAVLEDAPGIEFTDPALNAQVGQALAAMAVNRAQDRRTVQVVVPGNGRRQLRLSYVVPAPVWKLSYRLVLPADANGTAQLLGYAAVENLSGQDWRDVSLVLTSGQPVLYSQAIYEPVTVDRPEAPVDIPGRLVPRRDEGAVSSVGGAPPPPPAPMMAAPSPRRARMAEPAPAPPPAEAVQGATQVEFRLAQPVSATAGQSLLLPVLDRALPARRVALYQPGTDPVHPLVALDLRNDGNAALPAGLSALYDGQGTFIGDARLPAIQPGESRLASFAADLAVRVDMTTGSDVAIAGARLRGGVLEIQRRDRSTTTYAVHNGASESRTVLLEQPRRPGWTLAEPANATATPSDWRVPQEVAAGATVQVRLVLERPRSEEIALIDQAPDRLAALATGGDLPAALREALRRAGQMRQDLEAKRQAATALKTRMASITTDQARVRANLGAVPANSDLQRNYLRMMSSQEAELERLRTQVDAATAAADDAEAALRKYVGGLTLSG